MIAKLKHPYVDRLNPSYSINADKKKQQVEAFEALNTFVRKHGGSITSPPGRFVRIECPVGSVLPARLAEHYDVAHCGRVTRITGAPSVSTKVERLTHAAPSAFTEMDVIEITLSGK